MPIDLCRVIKRSDLSLGRIKPPTALIKLTEDEANWLLWDTIRDMLGKGELPKENKPNLGSLYPRKVEEIKNRNNAILKYLADHPGAGPAQVMQDLGICRSHWRLFRKAHPVQVVQPTNAQKYSEWDSIIIEFIEKNQGCHFFEIKESCGLATDSILESFRRRHKRRKLLRVEEGRWFICQEENSGNQLPA
jgi:hypothetical protein